MSRYNPFEERRKNERINRLVKENTELKSKVDKLEQDYDSKRLYADLMEQALNVFQSQTQEIKEQNAELVRMLEKVKEDIINAYNQGRQDFARYDPERHGNDLPDGESYYRTKYNHLKPNTK